MNDRFTQWLIDIEKERILGEKELDASAVKPQIFETDEPDPESVNDQQYQKILQQVNDIRYLIIKGGGMATKSRVEEVLMVRYECDRGDAHTFVNLAESANVRDFMIDKRGATWRAKREAPNINDWPEIIESMKE